MCVLFVFLVVLGLYYNSGISRSYLLVFFLNLSDMIGKTGK